MSSSVGILKYNLAEDKNLDLAALFHFDARMIDWSNQNNQPCVFLLLNIYFAGISTHLSLDLSLSDDHCCVEVLVQMSWSPQKVIFSWFSWVSRSCLWRSWRNTHPCWSPSWSRSRQCSAWPSPTTSLEVVPLSGNAKSRNVFLLRRFTWGYTIVASSSVLLWLTLWSWSSSAALWGFSRIRERKYLTSSSCSGVVNPRISIIVIYYIYISRVPSNRNALCLQRNTNTQSNDFYQWIRCVFSNLETSAPNKQFKIMERVGISVMLVLLHLMTFSIIKNLVKCPKMELLPYKDTTARDKTSSLHT